MKKCFFGAIAVLALASCSNEKVVELSQDQEIKFTATAGKALSRAADGYCNNDLPDNFQVWAKVPTGVYFSGEQFDRDGSTTTYKNNGESRYWPYSNIDFFAVKNATAQWNTAKTTLEVPTFTVEPLAKDQKDFIYAVANVTTGKPADGITPINFRHALSQIEFQAKNENTKLYVEIQGVSVCNINNSGSFVLPTTSTNQLAGEHQVGGQYTDNVKDMTQGEWSLAAESSKTTYSVTTMKDDDTAEEVKVVKGNSTVVNLTVTDPTDQEYNSQSLYLLPQAIAAWNPSASGAAIPANQAGSYFLVKCKIFNVANPTEGYKSTDVRIWPATDTYENVAIPFAVNWEQGKRYVYTFVFTDNGNGGYVPGTGEDVLVPIKLNVTVDDFVKGADSDVYMKDPTK